MTDSKSTCSKSLGASGWGRFTESAKEGAHVDRGPEPMIIILFWWGIAAIRHRTSLNKISAGAPSFTCYGLAKNRHYRPH